MTVNSIVGIAGLNKWFGEFHVLRDIDLEVGKGERIVICGPSGSGKSTLIRCINALEEFRKAGSSSTASNSDPNLRRVDEVRREVGMVFQSFNLFPHLTVLENCTLAPISARHAEERSRSGGDEISEAGKIPNRRRNIRASYPAASSSASRSPVR